MGSVHAKPRRSNRRRFGGMESNSEKFRGSKVSDCVLWVKSSIIRRLEEGECC